MFNACRFRLVFIPAKKEQRMKYFDWKNHKTTATGHYILESGGWGGTPAKVPFLVTHSNLRKASCNKSNQSNILDLPKRLSNILYHKYKHRSICPKLDEYSNIDSMHHYKPKIEA